MLSESREGEGHEELSLVRTSGKYRLSNFKVCASGDRVLAHTAAQIKSWTRKQTQETLKAGTSVADREMSFEGWIALRNTECIC